MLLLSSFLYSNPFYSIADSTAVNSVLLAPRTESKHQILCQTDSTFMSRIITGDESWESGCDPETEEQFSVEEPHTVTAWRQRIKSRVACQHINIHRVVHPEFVSWDPTVNAKFC